MNALESNPAVKSLLGRIEREIKRLGDEDEDSFAAALPQELSRNILYYVACAEDRSTLIKEVKEAFGLKDPAPQTPLLNGGQDRTVGPNAQLLNAVSEAMRENLEAVRDNLECFVSSDDKDSAALEPVPGKLRAIADALSMLNLKQPQATVLGQAAVVDGIISGETSPTETILTTVAGAVLDVELAINNLAAGRRGPAVHSHSEGLALRAGESIREEASQRLLSALVVEALHDMEYVKDALGGLGRAPEDMTQLNDVPVYLERIGGAMAIAQIDHLPALMEAIASFVSARLLTGGTLPAAGQLDALVDAVTSVECILESLREGAEIPSAALKTGRERVATLGFPVEVEPEVSRSASNDLAGCTAINALFADLTAGKSRYQPSEPAVDGFIPGLDVEPAEEPPIAAKPLDKAPHHVETLGDAREVSETSQQASWVAPPAVESGSAKPAAAPPVASTSQPSDGNLAPLSGEADEEILQVFIEEAEEQLAVIKVMVHRWRHDSHDQEALSTTRRSFHMLKGSGRLVGAQLLGEFAWGFENLLSRVIDGAISDLRPIHDLLAHTPEALAELIGQIKGEGAPVHDIFALMATATALSGADARPAVASYSTSRHEKDGATPRPDEGEQNPATPGTSELAMDSTEIADDQYGDFMPLFDYPLPDGDVFEAEESSLTQGLLSAGEEEQIAPSQAREVDPTRDPVLLNIFTSEAEQHLSVLEPAVTAAREMQAALPVTHELLRALHTLNGSALTADVAQIAQLCGPLERYTTARAAVQKPIPAEAIGLLDQALVVIRAVLEALQDADRRLPSDAPLRASIDRLLEEELARQAAESGRTLVSDSQNILADVDDTQIVRLSAQRDLEAPDVALDLDRHPVGPDQQAAERSLSADAGRPQFEPPVTVSVEADYQPDQELLQIFLEEARDIIETADRAVQRWQRDHGDQDAINELQRQIHTLKGGARMAGCAPIGDLSHAFESMILSVADARAQLSPSLFEAMHRVLDRLHVMLEQLKRAQPLSATDDMIVLLENALQAGSGETPEILKALPGVEPLRDVIDALVADALASDSSDDETATAPIVEAEPAVEPLVSPHRAPHKGIGPAELIRVRAELLDDLVNNAGEVNIFHARLEQQVTGFRFNLKELEQTANRLRDQLRKLEIETEAQILFRYEQEKGDLHEVFDPLELDRYSTIQQLSRALGETVNDLVSIKGILGELVRNCETLLLQQSRVSTDLQEGLMRTRMVQFTGLASRLRRIARQTANELGKKVELFISGETNELDRSVLDRMVAPLEHMVRNAIAHGIESPAQRVAAGKSEGGHVRMSLAREANEIVIKVEDDGGGISVEAVAEKARGLGMMGDDEQLCDQEIMQFILEPGFTTVKKVTQIAGRGVGMDVVASEVKQLGGILVIDSIRGAGARFTVRLPFTLAINRALLVQSGEDLYAVPLISIEGIGRLSGADLEQRYAQPGATYDYAGNVYDLKPLGALLGRSRPALGDAYTMYPIMLIKAGERRVALQVEGLRGSHEIVVKPVGPQISRVKGISGATVLGDGRVVLILDLAALVRVGMGAQVDRVPEAPRAEAPPETAVTVMVVDDSITIRKVTARMLRRNNFSVLTAKDGMDAVSLLQDNIPDLLLMDIEMPRMDGYELATYVRNSDQLKHIPIIMITSRTGEKHRLRAMEIGVNQYLGKPYQETELLENINGIIERAAGVNTVPADSQSSS